MNDQIIEGRRVQFWGGHTCGIWKFPAQELNLKCSCNLRHSCGNTGSLTPCATEELPIMFFKKKIIIDHISGMQKFLSQGLNLCHSPD